MAYGTSPLARAFHELQVDGPAAQSLWLKNYNHHNHRLDVIETFQTSSRPDTLAIGRAPAYDLSGMPMEPSVGFLRVERYVPAALVSSSRYKQTLEHSTLVLEVPHEEKRRCIRFASVLACQGTLPILHLLCDRHVPSTFTFHASLSTIFFPYHPCSYAITIVCVSDVKHTHITYTHIHTSLGPVPNSHPSYSVYAAVHCFPNFQYIFCFMLRP